MAVGKRDSKKALQKVLGKGANVNEANPLEVHDAKVGSLISYEGVTTADGAPDGSTLVDNVLATKPNFEGNGVIITSGAYAGQGRDLIGVTTGGTVTPHLAFGGQILSGTNFVIVALRQTPAEVAELLADVGDASTATLGSLFGILGDPAQSFLAMIGFEGATSLANKLTAARAALIDQITALRMAELDAANIPADIDTLLGRLSAARALLLDEITAARMQELDPANIPADIASILADTGELQTDWADGGRLDLLIDAIKAETDKIAGKMLFSMDFWSDPQEEVQVPAAAATLVLTPTVQVAERPAGATIVRVAPMFKFRMVENTYDGANALDGATVAANSQVIQVKETTAGAYVDAINFADNQFTLDNEAREGGDVLIGSIDIAGEVDDNGNYTFRWLLRKCDSDFINFNDVQVGLRIWYKV